MDVLQTWQPPIQISPTVTDGGLAKPYGSGSVSAEGAELGERVVVLDDETISLSISHHRWVTIQAGEALVASVGLIPPRTGLDSLIQELPLRLESCLELALRSEYSTKVGQLSIASVAYPGRLERS